MLISYCSSDVCSSDLFSCGSASVATLLTYHYETPLAEAVVFEEMFVRGDQAKIQAEGFSMLDIKQFLDRRGLESDGFRMSLDKIGSASCRDRVCQYV